VVENLFKYFELVAPERLAVGSSVQSYFADVLRPVEQFAKEWQLMLSLLSKLRM
jgi:hypothetical protein